MSDDAPKKRPGGRTARTGDAVRAAVLDLIVEGEGDRIQVADISARSGVHPTTIYRRWGTVERLVLEVAIDRLRAATEIDSSGSLRGDLLTYAARIAAATSGPDGFMLLRAIIAACGVGHGADDAGLTHLRRRGTEIQAMLDRYPDSRVTLPDVLDGILAPVYLRTLFDIGEITETYLEQLIDRLLTATTAVPATRPLRSVD